MATSLQQQVDGCLKGHPPRCPFNQVFALPTRVIDVGPISALAREVHLHTSGLI